MNKESLDIISYKILKLLENENIDIFDKVELMVNICKFLDNYDENIKILRRKKDGIN